MTETINAPSGKLFTEKERWLCIYPAYINLKKTVAQGRRLPKTKCVENPTVNEIKDVLQALNFNVEIENKMYPREWNRDVLFKGRVRVQIKETSTGQPINPNMSNKQAILVCLGEMIPRLKSRSHKSGVVAGQIDSQNQTPLGANTAGHGNKHKKKGRGKR